MDEVVAIKNGNETVFLQVYRQFHAKVFRFFLKRTKEHETAKELTQQTYIKLWSSRHTLSPLYSIDTQLITIAGSVLIDHLRKQARERVLRSAFSDTLDPMSTLTEVFPAVAFENKDHLDAAIEQLPPVRKKIMQLRMTNGLSNKEIAGMLDISDKTVEDHITKAVKYVRSVITLLLLLVNIIILY